MSIHFQSNRLFQILLIIMMITIVLSVSRAVEEIDENINGRGGEVGRFSGVVNDNKVNVRSSPQMEIDKKPLENIIGQVNKGEKLLIHGRTGCTHNIEGLDDYWLFIEYEEQEAWIYGYYIDLGQASMQDIPVHEQEDVYQIFKIREICDDSFDYNELIRNEELQIEDFIFLDNSDNYIYLEQSIIQVLEKFESPIEEGEASIFTTFALPYHFEADNNLREFYGKEKAKNIGFYYLRFEDGTYIERYFEKGLRGLEVVSGRFRTTRGLHVGDDVSKMRALYKQALQFSEKQSNETQECFLGKTANIASIISKDAEKYLFDKYYFLKVCAKNDVISSIAMYGRIEY